MNTRTKAVLIGGILGALIGALAGWLYFKANARYTEEGNVHLAMPSPGEAVKLGMSVWGMLRILTG